MKTNEIITQENLREALTPLVERLQKVENSLESKFGYIRHDRLKKETGFSDATIWRLTNQYDAFKPYRFQGSNKKFYKISDIERALTPLS